MKIVGKSAAPSTPLPLGEAPSAGSGQDAASRFYDAVVENRSVAGVIEAAREYGAQAGVPGERPVLSFVEGLEPWLQELQAPQRG